MGADNNGRLRYHVTRDVAGHVDSGVWIGFQFSGAFNFIWLLTGMPAASCD